MLRSNSETPSLFGLAPCGVCPARAITGAAVRSYRTFSPLPRSEEQRRYVFCGTFRHLSLNSVSRTLSGTLLCGVRTFLPCSLTKQERPSGPAANISLYSIEIVGGHDAGRGGLASIVSADGTVRLNL